MTDPLHDAREAPGRRHAYLPPRAGRARKLILRSQLGAPWVVAALLAAALILAAGVVLLATAGRPGAPWARVSSLGAAAEGSVTVLRGPGGQDLVVDRRHGEVRAFLVAPAPCPVVAAAGGRFARPCRHQAWRADGAAAPGTPPLLRVRTLVSGGNLYIDPGSGRAP